MRLREAVGVLAELRFAWYFAARTTTSIGRSMTSVALAFAVLGITDDPAALAQVLAAHLITMVLFLLVGGVIADRYSRTGVMQWSHSLTFLTQGMAAALVLTGTAQVWHLVVIEALNGAASAFGMPAMMGVVPLVVPAERVQQANAVLSFSRSSVFVVGPAVGGVLVATAGAGWALLVDSACFLVAVPMLARVRLQGRAVPEGESGSSMLADLRVGWGEFASRTWVWLVVAVFGVLNAIHVGAVNVLGPVVAKSTPDVGEAGWGLALSAEALGVVAMTVVVMRVPLRRPLVAGMLGVSLLAVPLLVLGLGPATAPLMAAFLVAGLGSEVFGVAWSTALQQHVPERVLSRVSSYDALGSFVAMPVGALAFGWLAAAYEVRTVLLVAAAGYAVLAIGTLLAPSVRTLRSVTAVADQSERPGPP